MTRPVLGPHVDRRTTPPQVTDDATYRFCCYGEAFGGPTRCTCWEPVYDLEQRPLENGGELPEAFEPPTRSKCCHDCAYRKGSPERIRGEDEELLDMASNPNTEFWCHGGMRRVVAYRHPDGTVLPEENPGAYDPPIGPDEQPVAWKADGTVAERCAGWASHRRCYDDVGAPT